MISFKHNSELEVDQKLDFLPSKAQPVPHQVSVSVSITQEFSKCRTLNTFL